MASQRRVDSFDKEEKDQTDIDNDDDDIPRRPQRGEKCPTEPPRQQHPGRVRSRLRFVSSVRYGAGQGRFSLCDRSITPARGQLIAVPPRPVSHMALAGLWGGVGISLSPLIA